MSTVLIIAILDFLFYLRKNLIYFSSVFRKIILGYFSIISNLEIKKEAPFYDSSYFGLNFYQVKHSYSGSTSQVNYTDHGKTKWNLNVNQTQRTQGE